MTNNLELKGMLFALMAALIWSGFILVSRMGGLSALTPYDVIAIRYVTCALILFPVWLTLYRFNLFKIEFIISATIGGLAYAIFTFKGFEASSALHGGILLPGLIPVFVSILSLLITRSPLSRTKVAGLSLIMVSITLLFYFEIFKGGDVPLGDGYFIAAAFFWALYTVLINVWSITPWQATCSLAFITCLIYLPIYGLWLPKNISNASIPEIVLQAFYQGFLATIVQMLLYVKAVNLIGPQRMGSFMALVPVVSGSLAVLFLGEFASWYLWSALLLVSIGVLVSNLPENFKLNFSFKRN